MTTEAGVSPPNGFGTPDGLYPYNGGIKSETTSARTREVASAWLLRFWQEMQRLGYQWTMPWTTESPPFGDDEVSFQWDMAQPPRRWFHVYVAPKDDAPPDSDEREVWYLRAETNDPKCLMHEGYADDLEVCRLLWHWFLYGKVNL